MAQRDCLKRLKKKTVYKRSGVNRTETAAVRQENAFQSIGDIEPGCEIFGFTKGQFCVIHVLEHVLNQVGKFDVIICTWTASSGDIRQAHRMLGMKKINSLKFIVDYSFKSRKPAFCDELIETFGGDSIRVTSCHAKFILVKSKNFNIVIRTSMNLNYNPRFENFEISDDKGLYNFMSDIVDEIWSTQEDYAGVNNTPGDNKRDFKRSFTIEDNSATLFDFTCAGVDDMTGV